MARNVDQEAFDRALVAVMDYFRGLLAEEREHVRRLEVQLADRIARDAVTSAPPGAELVAAVDAASRPEPHERLSRPRPC